MTHPVLNTIGLYHNTILFVWSLVIFVGALADFIALGYQSGWRATFCEAAGSDALPLEPQRGRLFFWSYLYFLSKYWEFGDTVLIVLRKAPLTFLHVYHHSVVALMSYLWLSHGLIFHFYGILFNTLVHVFMYWYYRCAILGIKVLMNPVSLISGDEIARGREHACGYCIWKRKRSNNNN